MEQLMSEERGEYIRQYCEEARAMLPQLVEFKNHTGWKVHTLKPEIKINS